MSAPENLNDLYTGELQDLWSANDQMAKAQKILRKVFVFTNALKRLSDALVVATGQDRLTRET